MEATDWHCEETYVHEHFKHENTCQDKPWVRKQSSAYKRQININMI